ncbi:MAG: S41 family peptidase [Gammaproteobacteria bacterium]|nr:S41 family peptidase [Gammaproteobacteria bacterium]
MSVHGVHGSAVLAAGFLLASMASAAGAGNVCDPAVDAATRKVVLETLARKLESDYAIPPVATRLAETVRAKERSGAYRRITCAPELAHRLTDDLYAVAHDRHLHVDYSFGPVPREAASLPSAEEVHQLRKLNGMIPKLEVLDGNVGYMRVNGVPPLDAAHDAVAAAFAFLHDTDALIIDDRGNHGGDPQTVALYMSYLSEGKSHLVNTFHWRAGGRIEEFRTTELGPLSYGAAKAVFVLTSRETFSGGEELAYDVKAEKRGVLVGEVTGGGANPGGPVPLGHQFVVNIPSGQAVNPVTGGSWEGVGVQPDVVVPAAQALGKAHRLAVERLIAGTQDPLSRSLLEAVAMKLESLAEAESGEATRLPNAQLVGTYVVAVGQGPSMTILEKDGRLVQQRPAGAPDIPLVLVGGNRYRLEGLPEGHFVSFRVKDGRVQLLREAPGFMPRIREKPAAGS